MTWRSLGAQYLTEYKTVIKRKYENDLPLSQAAEQLLLIPGVNKQQQQRKFNSGVKKYDLLYRKVSINHTHTWRSLSSNCLVSIWISSIFSFGDTYEKKEEVHISYNSFTRKLLQYVRKTVKGSMYIIC